MIGGLGGTVLGVAGAEKLSAGGFGSEGGPLRRLCTEGGLDGDKACELIWRYLDRTESHNTLLIDGENQSPLWLPSHMQGLAVCLHPQK